MVKKILMLGAVLLFLTAGAAQAQTYPPGGNTITSNDTNVTPGQAVTFTAQVFAPGSTVTFTLFSAPVVLGTATANSSGVATLTASIPSGTAIGAHTVEATGTGTNGQPLTVVLSLTVSTSGTGLPITGSSNTTPMTQWAIGAIAAGGLLVLVAKRRHSSKAEASEAASV